MATIEQAEDGLVPALPPRRMWTRLQIFVLALLLATSVCSYVDRYILPLLQEVIKRELGLSDSALGLATGPAFAIFYALSGVPIARLAERLDRRKLLAATVAFWSAMTALCGAASSLMMLVACRFGVGAGEGGGMPTSHSLLSDHFPQHQRGMAMAVLSMGAPIAGILMPFVGGYVAHVWGWRTAFVVLGCSGFVLSLLILTTLRDPRVDGSIVRPGAESFWTDIKWLFRSRAFTWLFVAGAMMGIGQGGFGTFLPSFMMRVHGLDVVAAGAVLGIGGVVGVAGTFTGGFLADRFTGARGRSYPLICAISGGTTAIFYLAAVFQGAWPAAFALIVVASFTSDMKTGPNYAAVQNLVPSRMRATGAAVFMVAATLIGSSIGPLLAGIVSDWTASASFPTDYGAFLKTCPGGRAAAGQAAEVAEACRVAGAGGLQTAMKVISLAYFGAAFAFYMCSRHYVAHSDNAAAKA